ncbi:terminase small subunit [Peptococcus simiae]|uniref:Terminase small subunit n=1 Tax=Peptococcus simiae TaxID=1643805 RepID=A0ABW9H0L6_9FIRM
MSKLTPKQKRFADEFIISGNKYRSLVKAGYSENYAKSDGCRILDNPSVKAYIDDRMDDFEGETIASQEEVLSYLTSVLRGEQTEQAIVNGEVIDVAVGAKDRIKAAELLGKRYGAWTERVDLVGSVGVTIVDDING